MQFIDYMIRKRATGHPAGFARKNHLSKSALMEVLKEMKEMGFPIRYSRKLNSYYYEKEGRMVSTLFTGGIEFLSRAELAAVSSRDLKQLCFSETVVFEDC